MHEKETLLRASLSDPLGPLRCLLVFLEITFCSVSAAVEVPDAKYL